MVEKFRKFISESVSSLSKPSRCPHPTASQINSGRSVHQRSIVLREGMPGSLAILFSVSPAAMRSHTRFPTAGLKMWRESGAGVSARISIQSALVSLKGFASSSPRRPCASSAASATGVVSCFLRLMVESRINRNADGLRCGVSASRYALERAHLPLGPPKILVVEHAELLAVRSLSLNPVLGAVVCYVKHVA